MESHCITYDVGSDTVFNHPVVTERARTGEGERNWPNVLIAWLKSETSDLVENKSRASAYFAKTPHLKRR